MSNFSLKLNLLRYKVATVANIGGKTCVVLPIEDNDLYASTDSEGKVKGVFLDIDLWESRNVGKFGDTHLAKQHHSKEYREAMSEDDKRAESILGNMQPITPRGIVEAKVETLPETIDWDSFK